MATEIQTQTQLSTTKSHYHSSSNSSNSSADSSSANNSASGPSSSTSSFSAIFSSTLASFPSVPGLGGGSSGSNNSVVPSPGANTSLSNMHAPDKAPNGMAARARQSSLSMPIPVVSSSDDSAVQHDDGSNMSLSLMSSSPERIVRFDNECVLIPDPNERQPRSPRLPMVVTKSYSLPLWKRRAPSPSPSKSRAPNPSLGGSVVGELDVVNEDPSAAGDGAGQGDAEEDNTRVVLKVPIPLFRRRSSRSPTRHHARSASASSRSLSTSPVIPRKLPPPCLVHRNGGINDLFSPTLSPTTTATPSNDNSILPPSLTTLTPVRRPSLTSSHSWSSQATNNYHKRFPTDVTIPLRACCAACEHVMDESLREGERWEEKFTRGARRRSRRSASLDSGSGSAGGYALDAYVSGGQGGYVGERHDMSLLGAKNTPMGAQFSLLSRALDEQDGEFISPASPTSLKSKFALTVDEVDKRRKSLDMNLKSLNLLNVVDLNKDLPFSGGIAEELELEDESPNENGQEVEMDGLEPFEAALPPSASPPSSPAPGSSTNTATTAKGGGLYSASSGFPRGPRAPQKQRSASTPSPSSPRQPQQRQSSSSYFPPTTSATTPSSPSTTLTSSNIQIPIPVRSSPIFEVEEDDESMLFPLPTPSPRRSPCGTPISASPRASPIPRSSPRGSPVPPSPRASPNGSKASLVGLGIGRSSPTFLDVRSVSSGGGSGSRNSSQESLLKASLSRRVVSASASVSGIGATKQQPQLSISTSTVNAGEKKNSTITTTALMSPKGPRNMLGTKSSPFSSSPASSAKSPSSASSTLTPATTTTTTEISISPPKHLVPVRASATSSAAGAGSATSSSPTKYSHSFPAAHPASPAHVHAQTSNAQTKASTPTHPKPRKLSFTLPFIRAGEAIRGAGADVLKGVSSIGGGIGGAVGGV